MTKSLGTRVVLLISSVLLAMMVLASIWLDRQLTKSILEEETVQAQDLSRALLTSFKTLMLNGNGNLARQWLDNLRNANGITDVEMIRRNGELAFYDTKTLDSVNTYLDRKVFKRRPLSPRSTPMLGISSDVIKVALDRREMAFDVRGLDSVAVAIPIPYEEECATCHGYEKADIRGVFAITISSATAAKRIASMRTQLWLLMGLLTFTLGLVLLWMMRNSVLRPMRLLSMAINRAAQGDRAAKVRYDRDDELGDVATAFNRMQRLLETSEARIRAVMDNVADGIIIANKDLAIEVINPAVSSIFGYAPEDLVGKPIVMLLSEEKRFAQNELPLDEFFLRATALDTIHGNIREEYGRRKNGSIFPMELVISEMRMSGMSYFILNVRDITRRVEQTAALRYQAMHDALTGLPNRSLLFDRLAQAISSSEREKRPFALLLMDLDRFKPINDTLGHHVGDHVLQHVATQSQAVLRKSDTVARLGGDEFAVLLPGADEAAAVQMAEKLIASIAEPAITEANQLTIDASIGIALFPVHGAHGDALMRCADAAMYAAKRADAGFMVYDLGMEQALPVQDELLLQFDNDLATDRLLLLVQPQLELASGKQVGVELLPQWQVSADVSMDGDELLQYACRNQRELALVEWCLRKAVENESIGQVLQQGGIVAVNVALPVLRALPQIQLALQVLIGQAVGNGKVMLELTERDYLSDVDGVEAALELVRGLGCDLCLDKFGIGGLSLMQLVRSSVRCIKLDASYAAALGDAADVKAIDGVLAMAAALKVVVIACGVNTEAQRQHLTAMGCYAAQGAAMAEQRAL